MQSGEVPDMYVNCESVTNRNGEQAIYILI